MIQVMCLKRVKEYRNLSGVETANLISHYIYYIHGSQWFPCEKKNSGDSFSSIHFDDHFAINRYSLRLAMNLFNLLTPTKEI